MARKHMLVGLTRHSGTEATDSSTATVFNEVELALRESFSVRRWTFDWQGLEDHSLSNLTGRFIGRWLIRPDASGLAVQRGSNAARARVSFRLTDRQLETVDPLCPKTFRVEPFERPLLERQNEWSIHEERVFEVSTLLAGSKSESARKALRSLLRKGLLIGAPRRLREAR